MLDKFASYNRFSNRSVELIFCMSKMNDLVVKFALNPDQSKIDEISTMAAEFDVISQSYKDHLLSSMKEMTGHDEQGKIDSIKDEHGYRL